MKPAPSAKGAKPRMKSKPAEPIVTKTPAPKAAVPRAAQAVPTPIERPKPLTAWTNTQLWLASFLGTIVLMIAVGFVFGPASAILVLTAFAFISVIALFWTSLRTLLGETPIESADAFAIGAPRVEEEQKRAVLRALKDLEFERGVGKISEDDYKTLVSQYREEAKRLLRQLDERGAANRRRAEMIVAERFVVKGPAAKTSPAFEALNEESEVAHGDEDRDDADEDAGDEAGDDAEHGKAAAAPAKNESTETDEEDGDTDEEESDKPRGKAGRDAS